MDGSWTPARHLGVLLTYFPNMGEIWGAAAVAPMASRQVSGSLQHPNVGDAYRARTETVEFMGLFAETMIWYACVLHRFIIHGRGRLQARIVVLALLPLYSCLFLFSFSLSFAWTYRKMQLVFCCVLIHVNYYRGTIGTLAPVYSENHHQTPNG